MKPFAALLWKDVRSMKWFLVFLFVTVPVAAAVSEWSIVQIWIGLKNSVSFIFQRAALYSQGFGYILSALLVYALNVEMYSPSGHSALSLPVRRSVIMLSKVMVIAAAAVTLAFLTIAAEWLVSWKPFILRMLPNHPHLSVKRMYLHTEPLLSWMLTKGFWADYLFWARHLLLVPGMICLAQGVAAIVKRRRFTAWAMTFILALFLFSLLSGFLENKFVIIPLHARPLWVYLLDLEVGIVFLAIGLFLFDRYAEV